MAIFEKNRFRALAVIVALTGGLTAHGAATGPGAPASAQPVSQIYDLYLGGIKAGEMTMNAQWQGDAYKATSVLRTAGIVGAVYKASFEAETQGRMTQTGMAPDRFAADSRMRKKTQSVEMLYRDDAPMAVNAEPAFIPKPWQVDPTEQKGAVDPITAALMALAPMPVGQICNRTVEVFDGRRRYAIEMGAPKPDGERIKCPANYKRIAGFKPKMMKKSPNFPFNIWFIERPDGQAQVIRAAGESMFGVAVILLRQ
ncbi:MAG: DUF3108 domain-containing protein [Pseudomonadota bacterium]